jgi:hypothetical protein
MVRRFGILRPDAAPGNTGKALVAALKFSAFAFNPAAKQWLMERTAANPYYFRAFWSAQGQHRRDSVADPKDFTKRTERESPAITDA